MVHFMTCWDSYRVGFENVRAGGLEKEDGLTWKAAPHFGDMAAIIRGDGDDLLPKDVKGTHYIMG